MVSEYIMDEELNMEYKNMEEMPNGYMDAYIYISAFVQYGMILYNYHYIMVEIAYHNNLGLCHRDLYNLNNTSNLEVEWDNMYFVIEELIKYLEEENMEDEAKELTELLNNGDIFL